jgi:aryl-alcohol dehydrogenase-like predicted oxidoreductase
VRTRRLGKTGLSPSELAIGTWGLSGDAYGPVSEATQEAVLRRALEIGITLVETADVYGSGQMERVIGRVLAARAAAARAGGAQPDEVVVVTRIGVDRRASPPRKRFEPAYLRDAVEGSATRLGRRPDVVLLHNPASSAMTPEVIDALLALRGEGKIGHWGASVGDEATGRTALRRGAEVIELAYNLLHPADLHRLAGEVMVTGAGVLARTTLAYGLLAGTWAPDQAFPAGDHRADRWTRPELERRLEQLGALRFLVRGAVTTMRAAAVRFVLANSLVSSAVLGPRSVQQLEDMIREVGMGPVYLTDADLSRIPRALEAVGIES